MANWPSKSTRLRVFKLVVSLFILLNIIVTLDMNRPEVLADWTDAKVRQHFAPGTATWLLSVPNALYLIARFEGHNVTWQMYSYLQRYDFTILEIGIDSAGHAMLLPEPLQSQRTWFESFFADFRETKYQLNIYQYPAERDFYVNYLCRHYAQGNGIPLKAVRLDLQYRYYVDTPADALASGQYFKGPESVVPFYPATPVPSRSTQ